MSDPHVVLNVDDFEPARFLRSKVLRAAGFQVIDASTASEAMQAVTTRLPDVALVDVDLPDSDGYGLCEALQRSCPQLPVVLVSAIHVSAAAVRQGERTGAYAYLREPVAPDVLLRRVADALAGLRHEPSLQWVITDPSGVVLDASVETGQMVNVGPPHLVRRSFLAFFDGGRAELLRMLRDAAGGLIVECSARLRPRERRPFAVHVEMREALDYANRAVMWSLDRVVAE